MCTHRRPPALAQWNLSLRLNPSPSGTLNACLPHPCALSPARLLWAELGLPSQLSGARMMSLVPLAWLSLGDS
jgi:hypothetical protein